MTLDEAIKYAENMAILSHKGSGNTECEHNHRQLAEWLRELKDYRARIPSYETGYNDAKREIALSGEYERAYERGKSDAEQTRWIPTSERLPEDLEPVNITWVNHDPESYYNNIKDKPFTATGVYFNGQWYWWSTRCADILAEYSHNYDDVIDDDIEIIAWRSLPEPYKAESEVEK